MSTKHFRIDARALISLGRDNTRDRVTALVELVKNSYDAGASVVLLEIFQESDGYIRIIDNGIGMSEDDIDNRWLCIGYSNKRNSTSSNGRVVTGEKGIGRLSADRLGSALTLNSKTNETASIGISVDWSQFETSGKTIDTIPINIEPESKVDFSALPIPEGQKEINRNSGTEIFIVNLRDKWSIVDMNSLKNELVLIFSHVPSTVPFNIYLKSDISDFDSGFINRATDTQIAPMCLEMELQADGFLRYTITSSESGIESAVIDSPENRHWSQLDGLSIPIGSKLENNDNKLPGFPTGPITGKIEFWPRDASAAFRFGNSIAKLREFIAENKGIRLYRDGVGIKPYGRPGDPAFDWLGLGPRQAKDPAGLNRASYKMKPEQLRGTFFLSRKTNIELIDGTAREGLIENGAFQSLRNLITFLVQKMEHARHKNAPLQTDYSKEASPRSQLAEFTESIKDFEQSIPPLLEILQKSDHPPLLLAQEKAENAREDASAIRSSIETREEEVLALRALSTLGIALSSFAHETENHLLSLRKAANDLEIVMEEAEIKSKDASHDIKVISLNVQHLLTWGSFALDRIRRHTRRTQNVNVGNTIKTLVDRLSASFKGNSTAIAFKCSESIVVKACPTDIESVVLNLLYNAHEAVKKNTKTREITVSVGKHQDAASSKGPRKDYAEITVCDSGNGVSDDIKDKIWEPLFSTRADAHGAVVGTGLGLTIVSGTIADLRGRVYVERDPDLGGAKFIIHIPMERIREEK